MSNVCRMNHSNKCDYYTKFTLQVTFNVNPNPKNWRRGISYSSNNYNMFTWILIEHSSHSYAEGTRQNKDEYL